MSHRLHSIPTVLVSMALPFLLLACSDAPLPTAGSDAGVAFAKGGGGNTVKHTFEGVTLTDGELVVENAGIKAGVRDHKKDKNDWTNCSYYTEGWTEFLGAHGASTVPGDGSADAVREFCVESFPLRE